MLGGLDIGVAHVGQLVVAQFVRHDIDDVGRAVRGGGNIYQRPEEYGKKEKAEWQFGLGIWNHGGKNDCLS
jgi:hypothetical protein